MNFTILSTTQLNYLQDGINFQNALLSIVYLSLLSIKQTAVYSIVHLYIYSILYHHLVLNHKKAQLHPSYCCTLSVRRPSPAVTFARLNARKGVAPRVDALYLSGVGATGRIGYIGINISLFFYAFKMYLGLSMATVFLLGIEVYNIIVKVI